MKVALYLLLPVFKNSLKVVSLVSELLALGAAPHHGLHALLWWFSPAADDTCSNRSEARPDHVVLLALKTTTPHSTVPNLMLMQLETEENCSTRLSRKQPYVYDKSIFTAQSEQTVTNIYVGLCFQLFLLFLDRNRLNRSETHHHCKWNIFKTSCSWTSTHETEHLLSLTHHFRE